MDLIILVLGLAVIGFAVWVITEKVPMAPPMKLIIYVVAGIVTVLWLARTLGSLVPNVMP